MNELNRDAAATPANVLKDLGINKGQKDPDNENTYPDAGLKPDRIQQDLLISHKSAYEVNKP